MLSFHCTWFVNIKVNTDFMRFLATKAVEMPLILKYTRIVLPWKQNCGFETRNLICLRVCLFMNFC